MNIRMNRKLLSMLLACSLFFSSCKKETEVPLDTESPEISFQNIQEEMKVKGEVKIDLNATDNSGITKVEVYINNELYTTLTEAPFTLSWITRNYPDGKYAVKAIAYDKDGNVKETIINVNVLNTLLKINVPETVLYSNQNNETISGWIFLSDSKGETLGAKTLKTGGIIEFQTPDNFNEDKVFINVLKIYNTVNTNDKTTRSTIQTRNVGVNTEMTLTPSFLPSSNTSVGTSLLNINNIPSEYYGNINSNAIFEGYQGRTTTTQSTLTQSSMNFDLYKSPVNNLVTFNFIDGQTSKYKYFENFEANKEYEIDFSTLSTMSGTLDLTLPVGEYYYSFLSANRISGDNSTRYNLGHSFDQSIKIYYPENIFAEFSTYISFYSNGVSHTNYKVGGDILSAFPQFEINHNLSAGSIDDFSVSTSGSYDIYSLGFSHRSVSETDPSHNFYFNWYVQGTTIENISGTLPKLPLEITQENSFLKRENLAIQSLSFTDYFELSPEEFNVAFLKGLLYDVNKGYSHVSYPLSSTNQRKAISKKMDVKDLDDRISNPYKY